jgi:glutamate synthase (NADPH/NADH)
MMDLVIFDTPYPVVIQLIVGFKHWPDGGEAHINDPISITNLQDVIWSKNQSAYGFYSQNAQKQVCVVTLCRLLDFDCKSAQSILL